MTRQEQWIFLDNLRRKTVLKSELKRILLKSIIKSTDTPLIYRCKAQFYLSHVSRRSSSNKIRNRCIISGRTWNVIKKAQYSRFVFRHNAYFSYMPGVRRSSW